MITVVVGKRRNTTPWFSAVCEKTARTATANRTNSDRKPHEPRQNRSVNLFLGSTVVTAKCYT
jgi:hypothetical protein